MSKRDDPILSAVAYKYVFFIDCEYLLLVRFAYCFIFRLLFFSSFILLFEVFSFNTLERVVFRTFSESPNFIVVYEYSRVLGLSRAIQRESRCNEETLSSEDHNDFMSGSSVRFRVSRRLIFRRNLAPALL